MKSINYNIEKVLKDVSDFKLRNKLTLKELERQSGVDASIISKMLRRKYYPHINNIEKLIVSIGLDMNDYRSDEMYVDNIGFEHIKTLCETLSIGELNELMIHVRKIRDQKIDQRLKDIHNEKKRLDMEVSKYTKLLEEES